MAPVNMVMRAAAVVMAAATALAPSLAAADAWVLQSGFAARGEYNDNYFLSADDKQSAFTTSISPFVTAARRTEASDVTALLAVGANKVWGLSDSTDYVSGRLGVNGSLRDTRSTWTGNVSFSRAPQLQNQLTQRGNILALVTTNAASVNGGYGYALTERWSLGATAGAFGNWYDDIQGSSSSLQGSSSSLQGSSSSLQGSSSSLQDSSSSLQDNRGYYAGGRVDYVYSARTRLNFAAVYLYTASDITRSGAVSTTLGFVHQFSPQLTISASVGGFWSDIEATQTALVCPTTPILCDTGVVPRLPITSGEQRRDNGRLYGGSIAYALSERTQVVATLSENLSPSGTGTLTKTDNAGATVSHRFSEHLTGRLGASYGRTVFPSGLSGFSTTNLYAGEVGVSYLLAERWRLDAGYRYTRAEYTLPRIEQPQSNVVFVSIGYGWPGASFTDWVGARLDTQGLPGAGPVTLSEGAAGTSIAPATPATADRSATGDAGPTPSSPESSPFDQFTIP